MAADVQRLFLKVITRKGVAFNAEVDSITGQNNKGDFDVLRQHSQFISLIKNKLIVRLLDHKIQEIPVDNAVMRVKGDNVEVFVGIKQE